MNLFEYQGRDLYERFDVPCAAGFVVASLDELNAHIDDAPLPAVIKAQVLIGGRGKAGGVKFADDKATLRRHVESILGMDIRGHTAHKVMVAEKLDFAEEYYLSLVIDRAARKFMMIFSPDGGMDIESVPEDRLFKVVIDPLTGFQPFHARAALAASGLDGATQKQIGTVMARLYRLFTEMDCELVEVNPLAKLADGNVVAGDSKVTLNDSALFRHPEFKQRDETLTDLEQEARDKGVAFIQLDGNIGVIANGAGLTMATLDALNQFGGKAGVFLDLSGTDDPDKVAEAVLLMKRAGPDVMLLNLFGGITKCDTVAKGLVKVVKEHGIDFPIITRIKGTNEKEAKHILQEYGFRTANTLQEAARMAAEKGNELLEMAT